MHLSPRVVPPDVTATLKLNVEPGRAAVFVDDKYVGMRANSVAFAIC